MPQRPEVILSRGGVDLTTPKIATPSGALIAANNFEPTSRGYRRLGGNERYDGQPEPHLAVYVVLNFDAGSAAVSAGDVVDGGLSSASAIALYDGVVTSGTYGGGDAAGYLVMYNQSAVSFIDGESLFVGAGLKATADGIQAAAAAPTTAEHDTWTTAAIAARRAAIATVPGTGSVQGVFTYDGDDYAIRDSGVGSVRVLYKATTAGWVIAPTDSYIVEFDTGTGGPYVEGEGLIESVSGNTAIVRRFVLTSGTWSAGDAAGYMVISGLTPAPPTFTVGRTLTGTTSLAVSTVTVVEAANVIKGSGIFDGIVHNFGGSTSEPRLYIANGSARGTFEFDGTWLTPIQPVSWGAADGARYLAEFQNHLFFGFGNGAVIHSGIGEPLSMTASSGAGEFSLSSECTGLLGAASTTLLMFGQSDIAYLTGTSAADFVRRDLTQDSGAYPRTAQQVDAPYYMDNSGLRNLTATLDLGGWKMGGSLPQLEPFFAARRAAGSAPMATARVRLKDHMLIFYPDKSGLTVYFGRRYPEALPFLFPFQVACTGKGEPDGDGVATNNSRTLVGAEDGYVYSLDRGRSFDGATVEGYLRYGYESIGRPRQDKRFHSVFFEVDEAISNAEFQTAAEFDYGSEDAVAGVEFAVDVGRTGGLWDIAFWDQFYWSEPEVASVAHRIDGMGRNCSISVRVDEADAEPFTITAHTINWTPRRLVR